MEKEQIYQFLSERYKLASERTEALSNRAHALLGFAGIINTILVAIILGMMDESKRVFLFNMPYLQLVAVPGFTFYVLSAIFSLLAFKTTKYMPVPQIDSKEFIKDLFSGKTELSEMHILLQIIDAIKFYDDINAEKYTYLILSTIFLLI
ncbi:MAG: hypothetical protein RMJ15_10990, partial [Nitrososphaerota archaeon]|nr:hypothetical protein [Nitrososphaerota archaeon]